MKVPFLDLKAQYESIKAEIDYALQEVIDNTAFAGGPFVARFEKAFAEFCGCHQEASGRQRDRGPMDGPAGPGRRSR